MVAKLSVHKNNIEQRRKRELGKSVATRVGRIVKENEIRAYAFVGIAQK